MKSKLLVVKKATHFFTNRSVSVCNYKICVFFLLLSLILAESQRVYSASLSPIGTSGGLTVTNPMGADSHFIGLCPPSGIYLLNYSFYYFANHFNDRHNNRVRSGILKDFEADIYCELARFVFVPKKDIRVLGGKLVSDIAFPIVHKKIKTSVFDKSKTGLGDIIIAPVNLFYHWNNLHSIVYVDFILPTGRYNKHDAVNIGNNHWTFKPAFFITYYKEPWEITTGFHYYINTKNNDFIDPRTGHETTHKAGDAFHIDYGLSYRVPIRPANLRLGFNGYYWKDITRDRVGGYKLSGTMTEVFSIGPSILFNFKKMTFCLKGQFEIYTINRPQGHFLWLKFIYKCK